VAALIARGAQAAESPTKPPFDPAAFPASDFRVTQVDQPLGAVSIHLTQARCLKPAPEQQPIYCSAWLDVTRGEKLLHRLYWSDFEPVGSSFGLFLPQRQPSPDYFVVLKLGAYDGRTLIVDRSGHIFDLRGGSFFVTDDHRHLVSEWSADVFGASSFDLLRGKLAFDTERGPAGLVSGWFRDGRGYFFTVSDDSRLSRLDVKTGRITNERSSGRPDPTRRKVPTEVVPRDRPNCEFPNPNP
jgi:hypothetical protein